MPSREFTRLRKVCLALPETHEQEAWGEPTFRLRGKMFAMFAAPTNHHGRGRPAVWIKSSPVNQDLRVLTDPDTFFVPPYMGPLGWVGMWLDKGADWTAVAKVLREGYLMLAPKKLAEQLTAPAATPSRRKPVEREPAEREPTKGQSVERRSDKPKPAKAQPAKRQTATRKPAAAREPATPTAARRQAPKGQAAKRQPARRPR